MITWEKVEEIRKAMPPRPPSGSLGSRAWDAANWRFERALWRYERENGKSWFSRDDWDYNLHTRLTVVKI
jgi:hypothetical protein